LELERPHAEIGPGEPRVQEEPVDVLARQAGVVERELHGVHREAECTGVKHLALGRDAEPHDRGRAAQRIRRHAGAYSTARRAAASNRRDSPCRSMAAWYCPFTLASGSDPRHESRVALLAEQDQEVPPEQVGLVLDGLAAPARLEHVEQLAVARFL